jgi:CheY-like chemotaxis protein
MTMHAPLGELPAANSERPNAISEPRTIASYILIVDDEVVVRAFLTRCLEGAGFAVKQAGDAEGALQLMMARPAAAVLCDIRLPGHDGLWLIEQIHTQWPHIPVVMATALDDAQTIERSRALGAVEYISKPIKSAQVIDVVRRVTSTLAIVDASEGPGPVAEATPPGGSADRSEAEYTLETPVRCPACGERITILKAVRLVRAQVNFTSMLPRRGRVLACPLCLAIVPGELTNF